MIESSFRNKIDFVFRSKDDRSEDDRSMEDNNNKPFDRDNIFDHNRGMRRSSTTDKESGNVCLSVCLSDCLSVCQKGVSV